MGKFALIVILAVVVAVQFASVDAGVATCFKCDIKKDATDFNACKAEACATVGTDDFGCGITQGATDADFKFGCLDATAAAVTTKCDGTVKVCACDKADCNILPKPAGPEPKPEPGSGPTVAPPGSEVTADLGTGGGPAPTSETSEGAAGSLSAGIILILASSVVVPWVHARLLKVN
jgi:hypothetical protein